jgi:hypothetical protein
MAHMQVDAPATSSTASTMPPPTQGTDGVEVAAMTSKD